MNLLLKVTRAGIARTAAVGVAALAATGTVAAPAAAAGSGCVGNPSAYVGTYNYQTTADSGLTDTGRMTLDGFGDVFRTHSWEAEDDLVDGRWGMSLATRQPAFSVYTWMNTSHFNVAGTVCRNGRAQTVHGSGTVDLRDGRIVNQTFVMTRTW